MRAVWLSVPEEFLAERRRLGLDKQDELWDGVLHMVPPPASRHQRVVSHLFVALAAIAKRRDLEVWGDSTGVFDPGGGWRIPDLSVSRPDQVSDRGLECAELVVEVLSPDDESRDKLVFYAKVGVREVWLIDPDTRGFEIFELVDDAYRAVAIGHSPVLGITLENVHGPRLRLCDVSTGDVTDV
jgi:Uma2 family endonuclease